MGEAGDEEPTGLSGGLNFGETETAPLLPLASSPRGLLALGRSVGHGLSPAVHLSHH